MLLRRFAVKRPEEAMQQRLFLSMLVLASSAVFAQPAAEPKCQDFRAISRWTAGNGNPFHGPVYAFFDGEVLIDEGSPARWLEFPTETCNGATCQGFGGKLVFDFGNGNTLTTLAQHGIYTPAYVPVPASGTYRVTRRIVAGTGRFAQASGLFVESGVYMAWIDDKGFNGRYHGELNGTICAVQVSKSKR
jgi:hypothetical protein